MVINEKELSAGVTPKLVSELVSLYETSDKYLGLEKLGRYYLGKQSILLRKRAEPSAPNTRVVCNHAKYIVDMTVSYLVGNSVAYAASDDVDISALQQAYIKQDIASLDQELAKSMMIYGSTSELVYTDEDGVIKSALIPPENGFVVYDDTVERNRVLGVYFYDTKTLSGQADSREIFVYDASYSYHFHGRAGAYPTLVETAAHYFGAVPMIEYRNNAECQGDFEQLIPLIDAYNLLESDRVNDKEQFVESFLFLKNIELDTDTAKKLRREKILISDFDQSDAKYLSKALNEADVKVLRDDLKDDIHRFSMVPDLSDESFGNNLSGVAIKYKLMGFEQHTKNKERYFARSLKERFKLYAHMLSLKRQMADVPVYEVDLVFTRNLPANELEISQMLVNLSGMVSNETLIGQLPFISDEKEEQQLLEEEQKRQAQQAAEAAEDEYRTMRMYDEEE